MDNPLHQLSRRERQIMDTLFRLQRASAKQVLDDLPNPPSYSAIRTMLTKLVEKGHASFEQEGAKYIYSPAVDRAKAQQNALKRLVDTFFGGSATDAVTGLLSSGMEQMDDSELERLEKQLSRLRQNKQESDQ